MKCHETAVQACLTDPGHDDVGADCKAGLAFWVSEG